MIRDTPWLDGCVPEPEMGRLPINETALDIGTGLFDSGVSPNAAALVIVLNMNLVLAPVSVGRRSPLSAAWFWSWQ